MTSLRILGIIFAVIVLFGWGIKTVFSQNADRDSTEVRLENLNQRLGQLERDFEHRRGGRAIVDGLNQRVLRLEDHESTAAWIFGGTMTFLGIIFLALLKFVWKLSTLPDQVEHIGKEIAQSFTKHDRLIRSNASKYHHLSGFIQRMIPEWAEVESQWKPPEDTD